VRASLKWIIAAIATLLLVGAAGMYLWDRPVVVSVAPVLFS
jgi:hypothetical protein